jgi:hypothetical protein
MATSIRTRSLQNKSPQFVNGIPPKSWRHTSRRYMVRWYMNSGHAEHVGYTHDEYCYMPLTLGTCTSRAGAAAAAARYPDANMLRLSETEVWMQVAPDSTHTSRYRYHVTAVERERWRLSQARVIQVLLDNQLHSYHYSQGADLFPDYHLVRLQLCDWLQL